MRKLTALAIACASLLSSKVHAQGTCVASLTWVRPTQNTDGTPLNDLASFKVYWGQVSQTFPNSTVRPQTAGDAWPVTGLAGGPWFFVVTAINALGVESAWSNQATKTCPSIPGAQTDITVTGPVTLSQLDTYFGWIGDTLMFATPAQSGVTRYEWQAAHVQTSIVIPIAATTRTIAWTPTRSGHWNIRVRACNAQGCGAWLGTDGRGYQVFAWLKPPGF